MPASPRTALPLDRARDLARLARKYASIAVNALGWTGDRPLTGPLYAQLSISDPCDQRCVMCCYHPPSEGRSLLGQFGGTRPGMMDFATFVRVLDDLERLGTRQIDLVGRGEPLLNPRALEMVVHAKERGFVVTMTSNGSRLTDEYAAAFVEHGLDRFRVSLDAAEAPTYSRIHVGETRESFERIKRSIRSLSQERARRQRTVPHLTLSFTIGTLNYLEVPSMVGVVAETGADAGHFQHLIALTPEGEATRLDEAAYRDLLDSIVPAAGARAIDLGIENNLRSFAAQPPTYLEQGGADGPAVVPCYVGSFFAVILGNGNVMPCCQTQLPVGTLQHDGFAEIWRSEGYREFRAAARSLPATSPALATCECDRCYFRPHNVTIHNAIHPFAKIPVGREDGLLSADHLLRMSRLDRSSFDVPAARLQRARNTR